MGEVTDWRARAACRHADPELFFPEGAGDPAIGRATRICAGCPVRARCLDWALSHGAFFGIWGGRTEAERYAMRGTGRFTGGDQGGGPGQSQARASSPAATVDSGKDD